MQTKLENLRKMAQIKLHKGKIRLCHADNRAFPPINYLALSQATRAVNGAATSFQPAGLSAKPSIATYTWRNNEL